MATKANPYAAAGPHATPASAGLSSTTKGVLWICAGILVGGVTITLLMNGQGRAGSGATCEGLVPDVVSVAEREAAPGDHDSYRTT